MPHVESARFSLSFFLGPGGFRNVGVAKGLLALALKSKKGTSMTCFAPLPSDPRVDQVALRDGGLDGHPMHDVVPCSARAPGVQLVHAP